MLPQEARKPTGRPHGLHRNGTRRVNSTFTIVMAPRANLSITGTLPMTTNVLFTMDILNLHIQPLQDRDSCHNLILVNKYRPPFTPALSKLPKITPVDRPYCLLFKSQDLSAYRELYQIIGPLLRVEECSTGDHLISRVIASPIFLDCLRGICSGSHFARILLVFLPPRDRRLRDEHNRRLPGPPFLWRTTGSKQGITNAKEK